MARILILDDEPLLPLTFQVYLEEEGHDTRIVSDGRSALESQKEYNPDLVIAHLASCDAGNRLVSITAQLRQICPQLPILRVSSAGETDAETRALADGATSYLRLPAGKAALLERVEDALRPISHNGRHHAQTAAGRRSTSPATSSASRA